MVAWRIENVPDLPHTQNNENENNSVPVVDTRAVGVRRRSEQVEPNRTIPDCVGTATKTTGGGRPGFRDLVRATFNRP